MNDDETFHRPETPAEELERLAREALEGQASLEDLAAMRRRCQRVIDLYTQGHLRDASDYFHAAWVLLCGETAAHFNLARLFAHRAARLGESRAWSLAAMAWDRWLVASGKPQRFGTQLLKQNGQWTLGTVDPAVSDLERAFYAVPPLYVQLQRVEQLQQQERSGRG